MPEYLAPGLYVEEVDSGSKPIEGVGTNTAAFIGFAKSGEFNKPIFVSSWTEFERLYGEDDDTIYPALCTELGSSTIELMEAKRMSKKMLLDFARIEIEKAIKKKASSLTVKSWDEFMSKYSVPPTSTPFLEDSYLAYAVRGFYDNSGSRCYIVRVARPKDIPVYKIKVLNASASEASPAQEELAGYAFKALKAGSAGNDIQVEIAHVGDDPEATGFTVKVTGDGKTETFGTSKTPLTPDTFASTLGPGKSKLVDATVKVDVKTRPAAKTFNLMNGLDAVEADLATLPLEVEISKVKADNQEFVGNEARRTGIRGLSEIEDINMICAPDLMAGAYRRRNVGDEVGPEICILNEEQREAVTQLQSMMISYCESKGDRQVILDCLPDLSPQEVRDGVLAAPFSSDRGQAAFYYPWIKVLDQTSKVPGKQLTKLIPPCGHVAGIWARVVNERGVHKAPANESIRGAIDLERKVTQVEQGILNENGINAIRSFPGTGIKVWGARTLATRGNPSWKYVNVRRLFNYLEKSIDRSLQWTVFEPNDEDLWGRVRRNISAFLYTEWRDGKLFGAVPEEAYYIKCDRELNTPETIDLGRMYVEVGINPVKPAEFVIIRMGQWSGGSETSEN